MLPGQVPSSAEQHHSFQYPTVGRIESRLKTEFSPEPLELNQDHSGIKGCRSTTDVLMEQNNAQYQQPLLLPHGLHAASIVAQVTQMTPRPALDNPISDLRAHYDLQAQHLKAREAKLQDKVRALKEKLKAQDEASRSKLKRIKLEAKHTLATSNQAQHELKQRESELATLGDKHRAELSSVEDRIRHEVQARMYQQNAELAKMEEEN